MPIIKTIVVELSRIGLHSIDGCDNEDAERAVYEAIEAEMARRYPDADLDLSWQTAAFDRQVDTVQLEFVEPGEDTWSASGERVLDDVKDDVRRAYGKAVEDGSWL